MRLLRSLALAFGAIMLATLPVEAQSTRVVTACGTPVTWVAGQTGRPLLVDINGNLCSAASASITGFAPAATGTPITADTNGETGTLPAGTVVIATNVGATNAAYCKLGASATTSDQYLSPAGGWFAFTVGAATQLTCITSTSTTVVNMTGGSGIATGTGGGGGSSGGGAVTIASGAVSSGAYSSGSFASGSIASGALASGSIASGAMVDVGAIADAAATAGSTGTVSAKLRLMTTQLDSINTNIQGSVPAGTATIGNVVNAPTSSSALALTAVTCGSAASSCVLKASAGNFYGAYAECTSACWLMVFNATSAPSNGATTAGSAASNLVECIDIAAASSKSITYPTFPRAFSTGITVAISSTACATLTLSTVGFISGSVM